MPPYWETQKPNILFAYSWRQEWMNHYSPKGLEEAIPWLCGLILRVESGKCRAEQERVRSRYRKIPVHLPGASQSRRVRRICTLLAAAKYVVTPEAQRPFFLNLEDRPLRP